MARPKCESPDRKRPDRSTSYEAVQGRCEKQLPERKPWSRFLHHLSGLPDFVHALADSQDEGDDFDDEKPLLLDPIGTVDCLAPWFDEEGAPTPNPSIRQDPHHYMQSVTSIELYHGKVEQSLREELRSGRDDASKAARELREEVTGGLKAANSQTGSKFGE